MQLNDIESSDFIRSKRDQFRVQIRKQLNENIFKEKRSINLHDNSKEIKHQILNNLNSEDDIDRYYQLMSEQLGKIKNNVSFSQALLIMKQIKEFCEIIYTKQNQYFQKYMELCVKDNWHLKLKQYLDGITKKNEIHNGYEVLVGIYLYFSNISQLLEYFDIELLLDQQFFSVFLETKNLTLIQMYLVFLDNLAYDQLMAEKMIFNLDITQYLAQLIEYNNQIYNYGNIQSQFIELLITLLRHEFESSYDLFKECIWIVSQFREHEIKLQLKVYYVFSSHSDSYKRACRYLYQLDGMIDLIMNSIRNGEQFAIMLISNIFENLLGRQKFDVLKIGLLDIYSKLLVKDNINKNIKQEIISSIASISKYINSDIQNQFFDSDIPLIIYTSNLQQYSLDTIEDIEYIILNIVLNSDIIYLVFIIENQQLNSLFQQLLQNENPQIINNLIEIFEKINKRLDALTSEGSFNIFDRLIKSLNLDLQLEQIFNKQFIDIDDEVANNIKKYLERFNTLS